MRTRIAAVTAASTVLLMASSTIAVAGPQAQDAADRVITGRVHTHRIMEHIETLSVDIGPRVASSVEEAAAADYIADQFASMGYDVEIQEFPYANTIGYATLHGSTDERLLTRVGGSSPLTDGVRAPVVDAGFGAPGDFPADTAGSIALIQRGQETFVDMLANATAAGAVGVMIANNTWNIFSVNVSNAQIPFVTMNDEAGEQVRAAGDGAEATLRVERHTTSQNVIATQPASNPRYDTGEAVVFVAHYDSVPASPGANDNASGTATLIELARAYAALPTSMELRFVAAGAEEVGLVGARYYVNQLPQDDIDRIVANFNMDMTGTAGEAQSMLYVNTLDGDNLVAQSSRAAAQRLGYGDRIFAPFHRGASDHVPFHDVGIPAANHIWREPGTAQLEPWYHTPHDTIDNVSEERLRIAARILAASSYDVIRPVRR